MTYSVKAVILLVALLAMIFLASGCSTVPETPPPLAVLEKTVNVDPEVMRECSPNLGVIPDRDYSEVDFVSKVIPMWVGNYNECRDLNHAKLMLLHDVFSLSPELPEIRK